MVDLSLLTASQAAAAICSGETTSVELVEHLLARIAKYNPVLNAVVTLDADGARRQAQQADDAFRRGESWGPLHGVPVTIKDSFETAGMRTASGYPPFADRVPQADAPPVARLRKAGALIVGKTNLPPLASGIQTDNPIFGRTNNPWDLQRTPGGSSGGAAAAVAAGLTCLDFGSDIGGSIRIPAHFCGIYGLKATGGRVSGKGHLSSPTRLQAPPGWEALLQLGSMGPLARSIEDLRLVLPLVAEPGGPGLDPQPGKPLSELCIAWTDDFGGAPLDAESGRMFREFAAQLLWVGFRTELCAPAGFDFEQAWYIAGACLGAINTLFQPPLAQKLRRLAAPVLSRLGRPHPLQRGLYAGATLDPRKIGQVLKQRQALIDQIEGFLEQWDAWICPVFPTPAFTHRKRDAAIEVDEATESQLLANLLHCVIFNVTGHPAVTLPMGICSTGLPVGVQVIGKRWQELALLDAAELVAAQTPGFQKPPGYE